MSHHSRDSSRVRFLSRIPEWFGRRRAEESRAVPEVHKVDDEASGHEGITTTTTPASAIPITATTRNIQPRPGFFANASHFTVQNPVMNVNYHDNEHAMKSLANHTIRDAEFDSSSRDPPPKCHPGTRMSILERAQHWLHDTERQKRILWFVGFAGAGKSAIMQTLAELTYESPNPVLGATLFFSRPNGRNNPSKVFITIAYQIAIKHLPYREFLLREFATDPDLPRRVMKTQFARLIIEPFVRQGIYEGPHDLLIFLDGLDECEGNQAQCEIIKLISSFSLTYPNAPLVWVIASRPESHLQATFADTTILPTYTKEEVPHDSDQACADVERYLREEFERIRKDDPVARTYPQWPTENEFLMIIAAAVGLFAYASTAVKFIDDPVHRNPIAGLALLLAAIKNVSTQPSKGRAHPLAYLDALYACILSLIPKGILPDTNVLLTNYLVLRDGPTLEQNNFVFLCNWAGMTPSDAYSALDRLHSILVVPRPEDAAYKHLTVHHQSFYEYLKDPNRSHGFHISISNMDEQEVECCFRIVKQAYLGPAQGNRNMEDDGNSSIPFSNVALSWSTPESMAMQRTLACRAVWSIAGIIGRYNPELVLPKLRDPDMVQIAKTVELVWSCAILRCDTTTYSRFIHYAQHRLDARIRTEFERLQLLRKVPLGTLHLANIEKQSVTYVRRECKSRKASTLNECGFHGVWLGPEMIDYDSEYKYCWYTAGDPPQQILDDLQFAQAHSPDMPVLLFGNETSMCLMYEFKTPDGSQRWSYYVPYMFREGDILRVSAAG